MKAIMRYFVLLSLTFLLTSCENDDFYYFDNEPPLPPSGLYVFNGDNRVELEWDASHENDVAGYNVYYSDSYDGEYTLIGSTRSNYFVDYEAVNGYTTYYGVCAYDHNGNESELSPDVIYAVPRPQGMNQAVFDYVKFPDNSGYSFSEYQVVPYDGDETDFFFENYNGTFYLDVYDDTDIQDMGPTADIYDIPYAPVEGWSSTKDAIAIPGHTYVIWTWDNHFAKIRVNSITRERLVFDWAYQLVEGERQLKHGKTSKERGPLNRTNLRETLGVL